MQKLIENFTEEDFLALPAGHVVWCCGSIYIKPEDVHNDLLIDIKTGMPRHYSYLLGWSVDIFDNLYDIVVNYLDKTYDVY